MKKIQLELVDFPILSQVAGKMAKDIRVLYPVYEDTLNTQTTSSKDIEGDFPIRWKSQINDYLFEWVISEMGSMTLRLSEHVRFKRNPPPIFYLSLGKYEGNKYLWEDPDGTPLDLTLDLLKELVNQKVKLFLASEIGNPE